MQLREDLEGRTASRWGADDWIRGIAAMQVGDEHLAATNYAGAQGAYSEAIQRFEAVEASAPQLFERALADGDAALTAGDSAAMSSAFELALAIAPDSTIAADGLRRAGVLDELVASLHRGAAAEREGEFDVAHDHFAHAVKLDPMSRPAQESLARVMDRIGNGNFAHAMSDGLAALDNKEYEAAAEAFRRAGDLQPESAQVADALLRVEQAQNLELILVHGERSRGFEEQERWVEALAEYDVVLAIDDTVRFAQEGSRRAAARADLARRIDYHIEHPDRLTSHAVYDEAELLLADATEVGKAGPRIERQIADLRRLLDGAATRVKVYLESDLKTEVTVYKIGRLGRFERHELELRAGTYTVVGTRQGYRDVRHQLVVEVDGQPARLTVSCTEKI
jgi:tetratricopeptide (TPR) repeat protein